MLAYLERPDRKGSLLRMFAAFGLGSISSLAMPPANFWFLLVAGLSGLYWLLTLALTKKSAFLTGWFFSFGYLVFGLSWIGNALLVEGNDYAWAWPLAVGGLPFVFAIYTGVATMAARQFCNLQKLSGFFGFVAWIAMAEWFRGYLFTGFPWNLYGYSWAKILPLLQVLSFTNVYFLTFLTIIWCAAPAYIFLQRKNRKDISALAGFVIASWAGCFAYGSYRINTTEISYREDVQIHIVQPNIPQSEKWKREKIYDHFMQHIDLSQPDSHTNLNAATYIIWPETSLNYWVMQDPVATERIKDVLALYKGPAYIMTGMLNYDPATENYSNAIVMFDKTGTVLNTYNKHHLVPFGEYIPFQKWIPLKPVAQFSGFTKGVGSVVMTTPEGVNYSPLVCYEIIFPEKALPSDFIVNVTNDSWYGVSAGPYQHLTMAVYRAIESGMPVARSASTGISALIDPLGKIEFQSSLFNKQAITTNLPKALQTLSPGSMYKNAIFLLLLTFSIVNSAIKKSKLRNHIEKNL